MDESATRGALSPDAGSSPARNFFVDLLRGFSILGVMWLHLGLSPWLEAALPSSASVAIHGGLYGVTVFFVVSGYLIATTTIKRFGRLPEVDVAKFAVFRFGRIVPFLLLSLALFVSLARNGAVGFAFPTSGALYDATAAVLSLQFNDYYVNHNPHLNPWNVMWSLSIEEMFYVFFPIVCRTLRSTKVIVAWLVMAVPFAYYARMTVNNLFMFSGCVDALSIGVLTAILGARKPARSNVFLSMVGMLLGMAAILHVWLRGNPEYDPQQGPLLCAIGAGLFIYSSLSFPTFPPRRFGARGPWRAAFVVLGSPMIILSRLGRASYEAYLLHMPLSELVRNYAPKPVDRLALYILVGVTAYLVNLYFTEPMNRIIRTSGPTSRRWFRWLGPALVASILLFVPNVIVARDLQHPRRLESVSVGVRRDKLGATFVPLIVYGEKEDAEFVSIRTSETGLVELRFDHWGIPPVVKTVRPELVKDEISVVVDCRTPSVTIGGAEVLSRQDMAGFSPHDEVAIGRNDIGGSGMTTDAGEAIAGSSMTFANGIALQDRHWKRGR